MSKRKPIIGKPKRIKRGNRGLLQLTSVFVIFAIVIIYLNRPVPAQSTRVEPRVSVVTDDDIEMIPTPSRVVAQGEVLGQVETHDTAWPKSKLRGDFVRNISMYSEAVALAPLSPDLPIPVSALSFSKHDINAVVEGIPGGMRAITVKVTEESSVEGWARSGSRVDVLVIKPGSAKDAGLETKVIAENVKILSAGRSAEPLRATDNQAPKPPSTVTLLVSQKQALNIKTAAAVGKITFSLRGLGDEAPTLSQTASASSVFGEGQPGNKTPEFRGVARDASGKVYILNGSSRWVRSVDPKDEVAGPNAINEVDTGAHNSQ